MLLWMISGAAGGKGDPSLKELQQQKREDNETRCFVQGCRGHARTQSVSELKANEGETPEFLKTTPAFGGGRTMRSPWALSQIQTKVTDTN